ncbi:hypothetical protein KBD18_00165 [Patescibacteria group bacterium]|nr:hypothetical protein [Patescibacteria group bacterium]
MRSHHLSQVVLAVSVVLFVVALESYAQVGAQNPPVAVTPQTPAVFADQQAVPPGVSATDLKNVGFTQPVVVLATEIAFLPPVSYFRVKETIATGHPEWGSAADLVAVSVQRVTDGAWQYNGGQAQIVDVSGRTQVRLSRTGWYIVVTGPDANKVVALGNLLKTK